MADKILNVRIQNKYDTEANWKAKDPVLLKGEQAFTSDGTNAGKHKIGDGTSKWSALSYAKASLSKVDVTTALGYTPPASNTWRGIQNNLTSDSTSDSLSAAQGKVLKGLVDGKATSGHTHDDRYYTETEIDSKLAGKAEKSHTHSKSEVGLGNVDNIADKDKSVNYATSANLATYATKLQTYKAGSTTETYDKQYLLYAQWVGNDLWLKIDNYKVKTDFAISSDSASSVPWSGVQDKPSTFPPSSHSHTKSQIVDFPAAIKNPNSIKIQLNSGTTEGTNQFTYDGSAAKTINITPSSIGAAASSHTHSYAGSTSAGGSATSAVKLDTTTAGSTTQPVYFTGGKPTACTYTLGKSVPSNAVFTDTTYSAFTAASASSGGAAGLVPAPGAGKQNAYLKGDGTWAIPSSSGLPLDGSGTMTGAIVSSVSSNSYLNANKGVAIINSTASKDNFVALARMNGSNGIFTTGVFRNDYFLYYTLRTDVANSKNQYTYGATLLNSSGNTTFPGIVTAKSYANTSDIRLKKNVSDTQITDALLIINKMKLRQFDWKDNNKHQAIGFIADELQEIDKNLVTGGGNDQDGNIIPKAIDSFYLLSYVVKGVQELSEEVSNLKAENEMLKQKLNM